MSGDPDNLSSGDCAFPGPYHGRPASNAVRIPSNSVPRPMPNDHKYVAIDFQAELLFQLRDGFWTG